MKSFLVLSVAVIYTVYTSGEPYEEGSPVGIPDYGVRPFDEFDEPSAPLTISGDSYEGTLDDAWSSSSAPGPEEELSRPRRFLIKKLKKKLWYKKGYKKGVQDGGYNNRDRNPVIVNEYYNGYPYPSRPSRGDGWYSPTQQYPPQHSRPPRNDYYGQQYSDSYSAPSYVYG